MPLHVVQIPSIREPIQPSPGFAKKGLSDFKLDACGLCQFGCRYCSSNSGNYLRINRRRFANSTEVQLGQRFLPSDDPSLMFVWPNFEQRLSKQLSRKRPGFGAGKTIVYSMLTDGFSPLLVKDGITERTLKIVLEQTEFRVRILTKNAVVGSDQWIDFFRQFPDRFVVGLSIGSLDDRWARRVEIGTSSPSARLRALANLQDAGIPTYGMLCPVFPDVLRNHALELLVDQIRPDRVEHVWVEPYNDRFNWRAVRDGYEPRSFGYNWLTDIFEHGKQERWRSYATELYVRVRDKAIVERWLGKLRFLLYETDITQQDAPNFEGFGGLWLQSKPSRDGKGRNRHIAQYQPEQSSAS